MVERANRDGAGFGISELQRSSLVDAEALEQTSVSEARLESVLDTAVDGVMVTNDRARVLMSNPACEALFGYQANEVIGRNVTLLMPPKNARTHDEYVRSYTQAKRDDVMGRAHEVYGRHKDGTIIPIELTIGETKTPAGRQFIGILRDLRQRHAIRTRMDDLQKQLLRLSRRNAVEEMGAAMAHELNQPLTALTLYLQAIERKSRDMPDFNGEILQILEKALRETDRAGQIIQRMRRFGKQVAQKKTATDISQLVADAVELTTVGYRAHALRVETNIEKDLPRLSIDPVQIEQILVNLLRNAIEAVETATKKQIDVRAFRDQDYLTISVRDSGSGIPEEARPNLFKTFSSSKDSGMGLGLAISNTIAQSHGGHFEVDPGGQGLGATFTLKLPIKNTGDGDSDHSTLERGQS